MKQILKLTSIGVIAGIVLILILKLVLFLTGNTAYVLLFNFDYIPLIKSLRPTWLFGYVFHFATCVISVIVLFYILKTRNLQYKGTIYILVYAIGGGALFFLTALSNQPPAANDFMAWGFWTLAHGIYGHIVSTLVRKWITR